MPQQGGFDWRTLLQAISTAAPMLHEQRTRSKQAEELARGQMAMAERQAQADQRIGDELTGLEQSDPQAEQAESLSGYTEALAQMRARGNASEAPNVGGERFQADADAGAGATGDYGRRIAELVSQIDAPAEQRLGEAQGISRAGVDVAGIQRNAQSDQFLAELRARRQRTNPWIKMLGGVGSQIADNWQTDAERPPPRQLTPINMHSLPRRRPVPGGT